MTEQKQGRGGAREGLISAIVLADNLSHRKNESKIRSGLRRPLFNILHTANNQKHVGTSMEVKERVFDQGARRGDTIPSFWQ